MSFECGRLGHVEPVGAVLRMSCTIPTANEVLRQQRIAAAARLRSIADAVEAGRDFGGPEGTMALALFAVNLESGSLSDDGMVWISIGGEGALRHTTALVQAMTRYTTRLVEKVRAIGASG